ncbi:hypothetical protein KAH81_10490 [bacterium]|nr:hypothetical protein [bacterium]
MFYERDQVFQEGCELIGNKVTHFMQSPEGSDYVAIANRITAAGFEESYIYSCTCENGYEAVFNGTDFDSLFSGKIPKIEAVG